MNDGARLTGDLLGSLPLEQIVPAPVYQYGRVLLNGERVRVLARNSSTVHLAVRDPRQSRPCQVIIQAGRSQDDGHPVMMVDCDCPAFHADPAPCPHIVAGILELRKQKQAAAAPPWESVLSGVLQDLTAQSGARRAAVVKNLLFFSLQERYGGRWGLYLCSLPASRFPAEAFGADGHTPDPGVIAHTIKG